uniref:ATP synthase F0 subunit 8 n=1 Tax=Pardosa laura TaxID=317849 RepID=A0A089FNU0_9ARAC|nr:ATP synthase F0 subunit 8 [Pardosa laura]AIP86883.1 ATP synthase F0 subunit 8 [Pardosa laura]
MPQLMPFYWVNSTMMILFIMISLLFLFFYKKMEMMNKLHCNNDKMDDSILSFNILW